VRRKPEGARWHTLQKKGRGPSLFFLLSLPQNVTPVPFASSAPSSSTVTTWPAMPASLAQAAMASAQAVSGRHRMRARAFLGPSSQSAFEKERRERKNGGRERNGERARDEDVR
jgi:hypothetical protein